MVRIISATGLAIAAIGTSLMSNDSRAGVTVLGPTPYYSKADSPFPVGGDNPSFFLEDFEPPANLPPGGLIVGEFSTPGATRDIGGIQAGSSIGEDDRVDGSGRNGWCGSLNTRILSSTRALNMFGVDFDSQTLGYYPTAIGFVLTHGPSRSSSFSIYNISGVRSDFSVNYVELDSLSEGSGKFIGVVDTEGISRIEILQTIIYGETTADEILLFDHFQYGLLVPEPASATLSWLFAALVLALRLRRDRRLLKTAT